MKEDNNTVTVQMTEQQRVAFERFQADQERSAREERARQMRKDYTEMVDGEIASAIPELLSISESIGTVKKSVLENFQAILAMKGEMYREKRGADMSNFSHTFTNTAGTMRITIGQYMNDDYLDTAETGIEMIRDYISSLATDEKSRALVSMVMKLLAKDGRGTLKAQRIIQLRKIADESGSTQFIEGVRIIEEAYRPTASRTYLRAWKRNEKTNGWDPIPLGMTES